MIDGTRHARDRIRSFIGVTVWLGRMSQKQLLTGRPSALAGELIGAGRWEL